MRNDAALPGPIDVGDTVRQYHDSCRSGHDDFIVRYVHTWGGLDVTGADGTKYGLSAGKCELIKKAS